MGKIATVGIMLCPVSPFRMLTQCLDLSPRASSMDYLLFCFHGLAVTLHWSRNLIYRFQIIIDQTNLDDSVLRTPFEDE